MSLQFAYWLQRPVVIAGWLTWDRARPQLIADGIAAGQTKVTPKEMAGNGNGAEPAAEAPTEEPAAADEALSAEAVAEDPANEVLSPGEVTAEADEAAAPVEAAETADVTTETTETTEEETA